MVKVGFIGLGVMGIPMSKNLIRAGYSLVVWNRTASKMGEIVELGAEEVNSPRSVAEKSDVIIVMVGDTPDVEEVILGRSGVIEGARDGLIVVDMSSISPIAARQISEELEKKGVKMLDAPVSGGDIGAKEGTLSIMVGGPRDVFDECLPIFQALGRQITYMGHSGSGQATKLCNQVICALNIQAVCEGLILGSKLGLDLEKLLQVVTSGYANSRILSHLGPKMVRRDFQPGFRMRHQLKDLKNSLSTAASMGLPLPCASLVYQLFRSVEAMGLEEKGTQASVLVVEALANHSLKGQPSNH